MKQLAEQPTHIRATPLSSKWVGSGKADITPISPNLPPQFINAKRESGVCVVVTGLWTGLRAGLATGGRWAAWPSRMRFAFAMVALSLRK